LSLSEVAAIRELAKDLPSIWTAATQEERQTLVRLLLERSWSKSSMAANKFVSSVIGTEAIEPLIN
jgi:hypothetical protein